MNNTKQKKNNNIFYNAVPYVAGIGLLATIYLIYVYYTANFVPDAAANFCTLNSQIDCDAVARTNFALFLGIPNAIWGFLFYVFVLILYFAKSLKNIKLFKFLEVFEHPKTYIFLMSLAMCITAIVLAFISTAVIKKICIVCFFTYILNFILLFVSVPKKSFTDMIITTINDFIKAISNKYYAVAFFFVVAFGIGVIVYCENTKVFLPPEKSVFSMDFSSFEPTVKNNELGDKNAKVVINEFTDIQCPFCAISNVMMNKIVSEYDNVRVIHHDLPFDNECNPMLQQQMHPNSCLFAKYGLAARKQNMGWGLVNAMFKNNQNLTEEKVLELAKDLGIDTVKLKKDAYSKEISQELESEIQTTIDMNIMATPTYMINGKKYEGILKYPILEKIIKDNGGVSKE